MCGPEDHGSEHDTSFKPDYLEGTHLVGFSDFELAAARLRAEQQNLIGQPVHLVESAQPCGTPEIADGEMGRRDVLKAGFAAGASLLYGSVRSRSSADQAGQPGLTDTPNMGAHGDEFIAVGENAEYNIPTYFIGEADPGIVVEKLSITQRVRVTSMQMGSLLSKQRIRSSLHNHGFGSEVLGSMGDHLRKTIANGFDMISMTDHVFRKDATDLTRFLRGFTFDKLIDKGWTWSAIRSGTGLTDASQGLTTRADGKTVPALRLHAGSTTSASAGYNLSTDINSFNGPVEGRQISVVATNQNLAGTNSRLEMSLGLSNHNGKQMKVVYRFGNFASQNVIDLKHNIGYMYRPMPPGDNVLTVTPSDDITAWCKQIGVDPMDNSFTGLSLSAVAEQSGTTAGDAQIDVERVDLPRAYQGLESRSRVQNTIGRVMAGAPFGLLEGDEAGDNNHTCRYRTGVISLRDYNTDPSYQALQSTQAVHAIGGIVHKNHPFGVAKRGGTLAVALYNKVATALFRSDLDGADNIEVYTARGGIDMDGHLKLTDGQRVRGRSVGIVGVGDDHDGQNDGLDPNATDLWATTNDEAGWIAAMARAEMAVIDYKLAPGLSIWCGVDDTGYSNKQAVMGATIYNPSGRNLNFNLQIQGLDMIPNATVEIRTAPITWQFKTGFPPVTQYKTLLTAADFASGTTAMSLPASSSCFYYAVVRSGSTIVGVGNPISSITRMPTATEPQVPVARFVDFSGTAPATAPASMLMAA